MTGGKFTWSINQPDPTLVKLDRALMSKDWEDIFPKVVINKLPRELSDHKPLIICTETSTPLNHLPFRFEESWLTHPDFMDLVQTIWNKPCHAETAFDRNQIKLKRFKQFFKGWNFNTQGARKKCKSEIQNDLYTMECEEEDGPLPANKIWHRTQLKCELMKILDEEELYWYKRSHETCLHKGDNNTDYFHRIANGKKRKNTIFSLQDGSTTIEGDKNLLNHATSYYKMLFGPADSERMPLDPGLLQNTNKLFDSDNTDLCKPFSEAEIKVALYQMERNKAAGPDKIPIEFY